MADSRRIEALLSIILDNTAALKGLSEVEKQAGDTDAALQSFGQSIRMEKVAEDLGKVNAELLTTRRNALSAFEAFDEGRDRVANSFAVFGDIDTSLKTLAGSGSALKLFGPETEQQLVAVSEAFGGVEAAARLAADSQALLSKTYRLLTTNATQAAATIGAVTLALGAWYLVGKVGEEASKKALGPLGDFLDDLTDIPVERLDRYTALQSTTIDQLQDTIAQQERYQRTLESQRNQLKQIQQGWENTDEGIRFLDSAADFAGIITGYESPIKAVNAELRDVEKNLKAVESNLALFNDTTLLTELRLKAINDGFEGEVESRKALLDLQRASVDELERERLALQDDIAARESTIRGAFANFIDSFDDGEFRQQIEEQLARLEPEIGLAAAIAQIVGNLESQLSPGTNEFTQEQQRLADTLQSNADIVESNRAQIEALTNTYIPQAQFAERLAEAEKELADQRRDTLAELDDVNQQIADLERGYFIERVSAIEEAAREARRDAERQALDDEIAGLERQVAAEEHQQALNDITAEGERERLEIIKDTNKALADLQADYFESEQEAVADFRRQQEKDARDHNKRLLEITRELQRDLQQEALENDVVGFIARQQQGQEELDAEKQNYDEATREQIDAFNRERQEARQHYTERRAELIASQQQELADLAATTNAKLVQQRVAFNQELTETEQRLQVARERRQQLEARFDNEDAQLAANRDRLDYEARLRALQIWRDNLNALLNSFPAPRTGPRGGYQQPDQYTIPTFDSGGIIDLNKRSLFATGVRSGYNELMLPYPKSMPIADALDRALTQLGGGRGSSVTVNAPITLSVGDNVNIGQVRAEVEGAVAVLQQQVLSAVKGARERVR